MSIFYNPTIKVELSGSEVTPLKSEATFALDTKLEESHLINAVSTPVEVDLSNIANTKLLMFNSNNSFDINLTKEITPPATVIPAVAEQITLVIESGAVSNGDITITLPVIESGAVPNGDVTIILPVTDPVIVSVLELDTIEEVATKIRNASYSGWTTSGTVDTVIFTKNVTGYVFGIPTIDFGTSLVEGIIEITIEGAEEYSPTATPFDYVFTIPSRGGSPTVFHINQTFIESLKKITISTLSTNQIKVNINAYGEITPSI